MKLKKKYIVIAGVLVVALAGGLYVNTNIIKAGNGQAPTTINVPPAVEEVRKGDISEYVTASGTVSASEVNGVYIAATQKVSEVKVKLGDNVKIGDVLVAYDIDYSKKELENTFQSQQISLQSANLSLSALTAEKSETEILQLENSVNSAEKSLIDAQNNLTNAYKQIETYKKDLEDAEKEVESNKKLLDVGAITQETYDQSVKTVTDTEKNIKDAEESIASYEKAISNAESSLQQANLNLESAYTPLGDNDSKINYQKQLNEIEKSKLSIQNTQDQISDLIEESVAHVEGTVIELNVEEGSIVNDQTNIMKIADLNNLIVNANVSEYDAPLLKTGQKVTITTDAISNSVYEGEVTYISPVATVTSTFSGNETTVSIEVSIKNPDGILKPGYSVDMEILVTDETNTDLVSLSAVQKDNQANKYYVYTVDADNMIHKTYIEMGAFDDMSTQVVSGVSEGDRVVTSPTAEMEDNTSLELYSSPVQVTMPQGGGTGNGAAAGGTTFMMPATSTGGGGGGNRGGQSNVIRMAP